MPQTQPGNHQPHQQSRSADNDRSNLSSNRGSIHSGQAVPDAAFDWQRVQATFQGSELMTDIKARNEPFKALPEQQQGQLEKAHSLATEARTDVSEIALGLNSHGAFAGEILDYLENLPESFRQMQAHKRIESLAAALVSALTLAERAGWRAEGDLHKMQELLPDFVSERLTETPD